MARFPKDSHTGVGAEVTYSAIHHSKVILRNGGHFTQGTWEWSTSEIMLRWSTLFHADHRTVKLNFSLLVSFHDGCGHDHCLVTVRALCCLSTGLFVGANAGGTTEVELRLLDRERLTGT